MVSTQCVAGLYPRTQRVNVIGAVKPWLETMNHQPRRFGSCASLTGLRGGINQ
jgi:hypothetical protein